MGVLPEVATGTLESVMPLQLSPEEFRDLADRVADTATDFLAGLDDRPIFPPTSGAIASGRFEEPAPEQGLGAAAFDAYWRMSSWKNSWAGSACRIVPLRAGSGEPVSALADLFASVLNQNVTAWRSAPAAVTIERTVLGWLAEAVGCAGLTGSLTSGGSAANLMGLATAREAKAPANERGAQPCVAYASTEVHMAVPKALALLGVGRANLRHIAVDENFRMRTDALAAAVSQDRRAGRRAFAIVASAGTVNTGAIDPLVEIADIARSNDLWLHVDGAYGALAALAVPERLAGLALADSISLDAHKWLYQPIDCSAVLYRDPKIARDTFAYTGDYAKTLSADPIEGFAFFEESMELSRRFRALKIWLSVRYHGLGQFRDAIREDLRHAQLLASMIEAEPALELLAPVELSAVCFRWADGPAALLNERNQDILQRVIQRGRVLLSNATLHGQFALRACIVNHRTTDEDIAAVIDEVLIAAEDTTP